MNFNKRMRLHFIETMLANYGHVNRDVLMDYFDIASACATRDFTDYRAIASKNMVYNHNDRCYYKTEGFEKVIIWE